MWRIFGLWLLCGVAVALSNRKGLLRYSVCSLGSPPSFDGRVAFLGPWVRRLMGRVRGGSEGLRRGRRGSGEKGGDVRGDVEWEVFGEQAEGLGRQGGAAAGPGGGATEALTRLYSHNQPPTASRRGKRKGEQFQKQQQQPKGGRLSSLPVALPSPCSSSSTPSVSDSESVSTLMTGEEDNMETGGGGDDELVSLTLWQSEPTGSGSGSPFARNGSFVLPARRCFKHSGERGGLEQSGLSASQDDWWRDGRGEYEILISPEELLTRFGQQMAHQQQQQQQQGNGNSTTRSP
eukprot:Cvel_27032.t1-p1 / transcript=Cvel_27032.t1 / gene=Cvel_27032 / organism=Chromera_velia_CCMP2878 / gene_product=hypothetical protein / transcript_product=hypothetical protein / location=Cvel_scaffold3307:16824-17827(+) / protein_length=290 / sequence_SO=supercontig / SO=protein_coding / is_pseudo=false